MKEELSPLERKSSEVPVVEADFKTVPFEQVGSYLLAPNQVITGIPSIGACDKVEENVCRAILAPYIRLERFQYYLEKKMAGERSIANNLRPQGFNGSIVNLKAFLVPFKAEDVVALVPQLKRRFDSGKLSDDTPGMAVIYSGDLISSRNGASGGFYRKASYFLDHEVKKPHPTGSYLNCSLGQHMKTSQTLDEDLAYSRLIGESLLEAALRHPASGGIPGLGKK